MEDKSRLKVFLKAHYKYLIVIFLIVCLFLYKLFTLKSVPDGWANVFWFNYWYIIRDSLLNYHQFYLWDFYTNAGQAFFLDFQVPLAYITNVLALLIKNQFLVNNLMHFFHYFLAGIGMYFLVFYLLKEKRIALISSLIYMFNGFRATQLFEQGVGGGYAYTPLILLFMILSFKKKGYFYSIITGILFALQILSGGSPIFIYLFPFFVFYALFQLIFAKRKSKVILKAALIVLILLCLSAIQILPTRNHVKLTERHNKIDFWEFSQRPTFAGEKNIVGIFAKFFLDRGGNISILGLIPFLLVLFSIPRIKNKHALFFMLCSIACLIYIFFTPLQKFVYNFVPFYSHSRNLDRVLYAFVSFTPILAGYGLQHLVTKVKKHITSKKVISFLLFLVLVLIIVDYFPERTSYTMNEYTKNIPYNNQLFMDISKDKEIFRINTLDLPDPWSTPLSFYVQQVGLRTLEASTASFWYPESKFFYVYSDNYNVAVLKGMANVKYVYSSKSHDIDGFKLVKTYDVCEKCYIYNTHGGINKMYLYANEYFLPEAIMVNNSVLVLGPLKNSSNVLMPDLPLYAMMGEDFNPATTAIIQDNDLESLYKKGLVHEFSAIFIYRNETDEEAIILDEYERKGGMIMSTYLEKYPDIESKNVDPILQKLNINYTKVKDIKVKKYTPNEIILEGSNNKGFIVIAEKFFMFKPDWSAKTAGKDLELYKVNMINTAFYYDGNGEDIIFRYRPKSVIIGGFISGISALVLVVYFFVYSRYRKKEKKEIALHLNKEVNS